MTCPVWNTGCEWKENEDWWLLDTADREARGMGDAFTLEAAFEFKHSSELAMWCEQIHIHSFDIKLNTVKMFVMLQKQMIFIELSMHQRILIITYYTKNIKQQHW